MSTNNRRLKENIDLTNYVNVETGQLLSDEMSKGTIVQTLKETNQFIINDNEFVVFSSEAIAYLNRVLSNVEVRRIFTISDMLKTDCCIVSQRNNHPHTPETLSLTLGMDMNKFYEFVRKMVKKNVLAYAVCAPSGYVQKIYMLNPYIARKRKTINCELKHLFRDVMSDGTV